MARETWKNNTGFILAAAGSAVGLGNIWKFPYLAAKYGGGAFLLGYLLIIVVIIKSMMLAEVVIGRAAHKTSVGAFSLLGSKKWKLAGSFGVIAAFMILSFYSVVAGWGIYYMVETALGKLNGIEDPKALGAFFTHFSGGLVAPIVYHAIFMFILVFIAIRGVVGGIEKLSRYGMPLLFVLAFILAVRSLSLPNANVGLTFYLVPQWSQLTNPDLWSAALGQAFFSMSLGMGVMVAYGSYLKKKANLPRVSVLVSTVDTSIAFLAGLVIIPAIFAFGFPNTAGPGLLFMVMPAVFNQIWGGQFFGSLFFFLIVIAAATSAISLLEVVASYGVEQLGYSHKKSVILFGTIAFFIGIGASYSMGPWSNITVAHVLGVSSGFISHVPFFNTNIFDTLDYLSGRVLLPLSGFVVSVFVGWFKIHVLLKEITNNNTVDFWWQSYFVFAVRYIIPLVTGYILLFSIGILHSGY